MKSASGVVNLPVRVFRFVFLSFFGVLAVHCLSGQHQRLPKSCTIELYGLPSSISTFCRCCAAVPELVRRGAYSERCGQLTCILLAILTSCSKGCFEILVFTDHCCLRRLFYPDTAFFALVSVFFLVILSRRSWRVALSSHKLLHF